MEATNNSKFKPYKNISKDRVQRWGGKLGDRNIYEAARLHETSWSSTHSSICEFHIDGQNGEHSGVSFCNRVFKEKDQWKRQGAVLYFRRSIDNYEARRKLHGPYLSAVRTTLQNDLSTRWEQDIDALFKHDKFEIAEGLQAIKVKCSCEIELYYQPFVSCCNWLFHSLELTELELTSVLLSMAQSSCSAAYILAATEALLANKKRIRCDVGYSLMAMIKNLDVEPKPIKLAWRFSKYRMMDKESERSWLKHVRACMRMMQRVREKTTTYSQMDYDEVYKRIKAELDGVGPLRTNHLIGISCIIGLLPLSLFKMVNGGCNKAYDTMKNLFPESIPSKSDVLENVHHLIETTIGWSVTRRYLENTLCKSGRVMSGSDKRFWDIFDPRFPLFRVKEDSIVLFAKDGTCKTVNSVFEIQNGCVTPQVRLLFKKSKTSRPWMASAFKR